MVFEMESTTLPGHVAPEENLFPSAPAPASQVWLVSQQAAELPFCSVTGWQFSFYVTISGRLRWLRGDMTHWDKGSLVAEAQCVYLRLHLGWKSPISLVFFFPLVNISRWTTLTVVFLSF